MIDRLTPLLSELKNPEKNIDSVINSLIPGGNILMLALYLEESYDKDLAKGEYAKTIIYPLLKEKHNIFAHCNDGRSAIWFAYSLETLDLLFEHGANIHETLPNKTNILDMYVLKSNIYGFNKYEERIKYCLDKGLNPTVSIMSEHQKDTILPLLEKIKLSGIVSNKATIHKIKI